MEIEGADARHGPRSRAHPLGDELGQASVSFVATLPLIVLLCMGGLQVVFAGHASILAGQAARAAARADYVGEDVERAARAALPPAMREGVVVSAGARAVRVRLTATRVLPFGPRIPVESRSSMGPGAGAGDG